MSYEHKLPCLVELQYVKFGEAIVYLEKQYGQQYQAGYNNSGVWVFAGTNERSEDNFRFKNTEDAIDAKLRFG